MVSTEALFLFFYDVFGDLCEKRRSIVEVFLFRVVDEATAFLQIFDEGLGFCFIEVMSVFMKRSDHRFHILVIEGCVWYQYEYH